MDTKQAGKKGGQATLKKYGVEHFRKIRRIVKKKKALASEVDMKKEPKVEDKKEKIK